METVAIKDSENNRSFTLLSGGAVGGLLVGWVGAMRESYAMSPLRARKLQIFS